MRRLGFGLISTLVLLGIGVAESRSAQQPGGTPLANSVILIIRHAEKPDEGAGLTTQGEKRAQAYVGYFGAYKLDGKRLTVSHLFAASDSEASQRPRLTVEPFSNSTHTKIDLRFSDKDPVSIATDLKTHNYGHQILICWRHGKIPALVKALGGDPLMFVPEGKWPASAFDRVIELHFDSQGKLDTHTSRLVLEHLLPGDEK